MARTKDPQKVPRPCNPFFQFRRVIIGELQSTKPQRNLSKEISRMWKALSPEEKAIYIAMAEDEKLWHKEMYPDYQYRPKRNKKKAVVKIEDGGLSPPSTSRSSSLASSSASTPAPSTPDITTTILPAGLSSSHVAFDCNSKSGEGFVLNHPVPPNVHANTGLPPSVQPNGHPWSPRVAGWTEPPPFQSASTSGMHWQSLSNASSLLPQSAETAQGLFTTPNFLYYYQPRVSYTPQQVFPPLEAHVQLPSRVVNTQPRQQAPQRAVNQVLPPSQAHTGAPQPRTEPLFSGVARSSELEAWEKEFAPLDAGFCDFMSAWTNIKPSTSICGAVSFPSPSLASDATFTAASLPPASASNLNAIATDHTQELPTSQTEDPLVVPSAFGFFDSSFMSPSDPLYGQLRDPFQDLPPSVVWPEALNPLGIYQM